MRKLNRGWKRLLAVVAGFWLLGWGAYIGYFAYDEMAARRAHREAVSMAQFYSGSAARAGGQRLSDIELDRAVALDSRANADRRAWSGAVPIALFGPIVLLIMAGLAAWIVRGFRSDQTDCL